MLWHSGSALASIWAFDLGGRFDRKVLVSLVALRGMGILRQSFSRTTADAIHVGTTVRYHWRDGTGLATVIEKTDRHVAFRGPECDGRFTHDQIDWLIQDGRLEVVLDDLKHDRRELF